MDTSKALKVQTCLKWQCEIPRSGCREESEIFNVHGFDRRFRLLADANKPSCLFLYVITLNSNGGMIPLEMTVYLETPNGELKFSSRASTNDPVYCIRTYRKEEIDMVLQRGWKSIPFVFVLEAVELKLSSNREYGLKVYSPDSSDLETFSNDIGKLQNDATNCDIFLDVDGETFHAHRHIICARGKKFEEKCQGFVVRQTPAVVKIDGVDKDTFREILHYIYNGKLSRNLETPGFAERLYRAARIFGLDQLAIKCSNWFLKSLPENVYGLLILADSEKDKELKETLICYLFDQKMLLQDGWKDFAKKREAFELVFEIYHRFYVSHALQ